jgi:hypothetical protein
MLIRIGLLKMGGSTAFQYANLVNYEARKAVRA